MQFLFCSGAEYLKIPIIEKGFRLIRSKTQKFANGEMAVSIIDEIDVDEPVCVMQSVALGNVNDYVIELLLCLDALKRVGVSVIDIVLPYMPYARQDRPMDHGYSVGAKVMINLLSEYNPRSVSTIDIHNDRIVAFMDNEMVNIKSDIIFENITHPVISNTEKFVTDLLASKISHLTVSNTMNNIVDNKKISYISCINSIVDSVINRVRR